MKKIKKILDNTDTTKNKEEVVTGVSLNMLSESVLKYGGNIIPKDEIEKLKEKAKIETAIHNFFEKLKIFMIINK